MIGGEVYSTEKGKCNGIEVYLNPTANDSNTSCTKEDYSKNSGTDKKEGCMKWYVYDVSDNGYTMILDHNTSNKVAWVSQDDYDSAESIATGLGITYFGIQPSGDYKTNTDEHGNITGGNNDKGPLTALNQLKTDTQNWTAISNRTDTYTAETTSGNGYTINYENYKAKLISAEEVNSIVRNANWTPSSGWYYLDSLNQTEPTRSKGSSAYAWLYSNLTNCEGHGCNVNLQNPANIWSYWTSTACVDDSSRAWNVHHHGRMYDDSFVSLTDRGVRPVITVSKSKLLN